MKKISLSLAVILAVFTVSAFTVHADYHDNTVPFFGDFHPESTSNSRYYRTGGYYPDYSYNYTPPVVSCYVSPENSYTGVTVAWTAYATGGNGYYTYSWSGDENLYGSGKTVYKSYAKSGQKRAYVTVYSAGHSITQSCSNRANISNRYDYNYYPYQTPVYNYPYQTYPYGYASSNIGLDVGCYADPSNVKVNQPVTWIVEVTGGVGPYTYSWTGSDGLTGSQSSVIKYYSTSGSKSAIVSVTSADGLTSNRACSNQVTVGATTAYKAPTTVAKPVVTAPVSIQNTDTANNNVARTDQVAAVGAFSLAYVPWGWVAVIVILILFATVLYLLFNREKI